MTVREWFRANRGHVWEHEPQPVTLYFQTGYEGRVECPGVSFYSIVDYMNWIDNTITPSMLTPPSTRERLRKIRGLCE